MSQLTIKPQERSDLYMALMMWANYIETGYPNSSNQDLKNQGRSKEVKLLTTEQMKRIVELRELADRMYK